MSRSLVNSSLIHDTAVLKGEIVLGEDVSVGAYSVLTGPLEIHAGCIIGSHCTLGGAPEHRLHKAAGRIVVGAKTVIRDAVVIHHGTSEAGTRIGADCYIMSRAYVAHDCQIGDGVILAAGCTIGGHSYLHQGSNVGMNAAVHQYSTIGAYSMIGMSTPVNKDVPPFSVVAGNPMRFLRVNQLGIERAGIEAGQIEVTQEAIVYDRSSPLTAEFLREFIANSRRKPLFDLNYKDQPIRKPR